jgi:hypothetical protein
MLSQNDLVTGLLFEIGDIAVVAKLADALA